MNNNGMIEYKESFITKIKNSLKIVWKKRRTI